MTYHWRSIQWQQRVEAEYKEPAKEVIRVLHHDMKQPLHVIAGTLGICKSTVSKWCKIWAIEVRGQSYGALIREGKVQLRAKELGYDSVQQAVCSMRVEGLRWCDIQKKLDCAESTISRYLTPDFLGYHHVSDEGREIKRQNAKKLNERMARGEIERGGFAKWWFEYS